ncbi:carboxypeptidase-like regulatory domain-containing protein [Mesonia ostreae]|uniref:Carboxypeptidase-like regulatory domain-containing protein n=1 Tax=Mesonia ostreae TaxID=861110 RepID=A0ABU2KJF7_9FLAO|nr:carboxypeptidase-like regulatory domain-containing protein [Mesonia ostreae]MDT0294814.1 carboxypeptidase-like regulatory domain-containing protein [Mesonia ostreae]
MTNKKLLFFLLLFKGIFIYAQHSIRGVIVDESQQPIESANIYFDGTTFGTVTNSQGEFTLQLSKAIQAPLIISSLGYTSEIKKISFETSSINIGVIALKEGVNDLEEVYLENDPWPRKRKLKYFRKWFLGADYKDKKTKILNEEEVLLRFIPSSNTLVASSKIPLKIKNKHLSYLIAYDLVEFELQFKKVIFTKDGKRQTHYNEYSSFYAGTSFFKELKENTRTKFLERREKAYEGSILHFMRSLASKKLEENKYKIFHKRFQVPTYQFLKVVEGKNRVAIDFLSPKIIVLYDDFEQSFIQINKNPTTIYIDAYGNFSPINSLYFGGDMGKQKISSLLPLNYKINSFEDE